MSDDLCTPYLACLLMPILTGFDLMGMLRGNHSFLWYDGDMMYVYTYQVCEG